MTDRCYRAKTGLPSLGIPVNKVQRWSKPSDAHPQYISIIIVTKTFLHIITICPHLTVVNILAIHCQLIHPPDITGLVTGKSSRLQQVPKVPLCANWTKMEQLLYIRCILLQSVNNHLLLLVCSCETVSGGWIAKWVASSGRVPKAV